MSKKTAPGPGLEAAQEMLYGNRSLEERFGKLSGRSLQDQIFTTYEAGHGPGPGRWYESQSQYLFTNRFN